MKIVFLKTLKVRIKFIMKVDQTLLMKFLQTKPQVKNMNIKYYDLYYTVIKKRDEKENVDNKNEVNENDYNIFIASISPNHFIGRKKIMSY